MPGRTPNQAIVAFADPLKEALGCVGDCNLSRSSTGKTTRIGESYGIESEVLGKTTSGDSVEIEVEMKFHVYEVENPDTPDGKYRARVESYVYTISVANTELVAFHWHPEANGGAVLHPHVHFRALRADIGNLEKLGHIPTGRVTLESIIAWLIEDIGVKPRKDGWKETLRQIHENVTKHWRKQVPSK